MVFDVPNHLEENRCFCCGPLNPQGMQLQFYQQGNELCCDWPVDDRFLGFAQVLHGGIQAALLDEVAVWAVAVFHRRLTATAELNLSYTLPVKRGMQLTAAGRVVEVGDGEFRAVAELRGADGKARTSATARLQVVTPALFRRFTGWRDIPPGWAALFEPPGGTA